MWTPVSVDFFSDPSVQIYMQISAGVALPLCIYLVFVYGWKACSKFLLVNGFRLAVLVTNICLVVSFFCIDIVVYTYETSHGTKLSQEDILLMYLLIHSYFALWRFFKYSNWELKVCELMICLFLGGILAFFRFMDQSTIHQYNLQIKTAVCQWASAYVVNCPFLYDYAIGFGLNQWQNRWIIYFLDRVWYFEVQAVSLTFFWILIENIFRMIKSTVCICLFFWRRK